MFNSLILMLFVGIFVIPNNSLLSLLTNHVDEEEATFIQTNITSMSALDDYFNNIQSFGLYSESQPNIAGFHLEQLYPDYTFSTLIHKEVSDASGAIPLNISTDPYSYDDILQTAIQSAGITTQYAGCGPNAMVGIFDYFARYLNYNKIATDLDYPNQRIALATMVFQNSKTYDVSMFTGENDVMMFAWDYADAFNSIIADKELTNLIHANCHFTVIGNHFTSYWNFVKESIDNGLPVTLMTSASSGTGTFGAHATNIYGYETIEGVNAQNEKIYRHYLLAQTNKNIYHGRYCDARILNDPFIGLITYDLPVANYRTIHASDTAGVFVNSNGNGQYFFDSKMDYLNIDGYNHTTIRLRTSYIENQYLVMSPNRVGAGEAYLNIESLGRINFLRFHAGMWGYHEGIGNEIFFVEAVVPGIGYKTITYFDLSQIGWKENMTLHTVLLPYNTGAIRFRALHSNPTATTNKGRICLENIQFSYTSFSDS